MCGQGYAHPGVSLAAVAAVSPSSLRPTVGDRVVLSSDYASHADASGGPLRPGDVGVVEKDDRSGEWPSSHDGVVNLDSRLTRGAFEELAAVFAVFDRQALPRQGSKWVNVVVQGRGGAACRGVDPYPPHPTPPPVVVHSISGHLFAIAPEVLPWAWIKRVVPFLV